MLLINRCARLEKIRKTGLRAHPSQQMRQRGQNEKTLITGPPRQQMRQLGKHENKWSVTLIYLIVLEC